MYQILEEDINSHIKLKAMKQRALKGALLALLMMVLLVIGTAIFILSLVKQ